MNRNGAHMTGSHGDWNDPTNSHGINPGDVDRVYDGMTDEMHISVNERGRIRVALTRNMSALGVKLGGTNMLINVLCTLGIFAAPVIIGATMWLGNSNYDVTTKSIIGIAIFGGYLLLFPLTVVLYCRRRVALIFLGSLVAMGLLVAAIHLVPMLIL